MASRTALVRRGLLEHLPIRSAIWTASFRTPSRLRMTRSPRIVLLVEQKSLQVELPAADSDRAPKLSIQWEQLAWFPRVCSPGWGGSWDSTTPSRHLYRREKSHHALPVSW